MRIVIVGAGPAGLFFALLMKRARPRDELVVIEQNPRDATFGFGVVFSRGALEFLSRDAPEMHARLAAAMESWPIQRIVHRDAAVDIDGNGFSALGRLRLLQMLHGYCEAAGVDLRFDSVLSEPPRGFDLVVGADGVNSLVRRSAEDRFRPKIEYLTNKFVWYGTTRLFECLTLTFRSSEHGAFVAHHYRYSPQMSTFIVECEAATWHRAGLGRMSDAESRAYCERVFAPDLGRHKLVSNKSIWRNFPLLQNEVWFAGNAVLIGDALRTGHFSIGSGTRLALDDAIALARAFESAGDDVGSALREFERQRRPVVEKLVAAANQSSYWYERLDDKMALEPKQLAYDYMTRSGRMTDERLHEEAPRFMAGFESSRPERIADPVPREAPGALEIAFNVPDQYNAAEMLFSNLPSRASKVAVLCGERRVTYGELCEAACRVGNGLAAMGLARGSRVLLLMHDTPEYVAAIFGAIRGGFVPILVNTLSGADLVAYYLQDSGAEAAIVEDELAHLAEPGKNRLRRTLTRSDWSAWVAAHSPQLAAAHTHRNEMAFWMYSSGSTGRPKGVVHLQHDGRYTYESYGRRILGIHADDLVFSPPKIFFAYGFGNSLTFPFCAGATSVLYPGRPDPEAVLAAIERHRPSILFGLPTLYNALAAHPGSDKRDLSSLRLCVSAAEVLSAELFNEWERRYGLRIVEGLGSTELLHIYLSNRRERQKLGASGARVPGYEVRLEEGVMCVRADSQAPFYWKQPEKTARTMRADGWIWTGDRFSVDAEGFYTFEGRADDLVKVSGQWVYPLEIERCLAEHPLVRECAVLAVEDDRKLTTIAAYVVLRDGREGDKSVAKHLQEFVKQRLVPYKYPRHVEFFDTLPKTGTGKVDRQALRIMNARNA